MEPAALGREVKARAYAAGFDLCGIARLDPPRTGASFRHWLAAGYAGTMQWMARTAETRLDPMRAAPPLHTAIVVAMNYGGTQPGGAIARYARGTDYHEVIRHRLLTLHHSIEVALGHPIPARPYTDTGPLLERDLAQQAGLGWFGKNTMLIHPGLGSFFFLGALLVDLDVATDEPFAADRCGRCRRCLDACPTGALVGPRELDARRCLSYLTIELRDALPHDLRPLLGDLVFGCDICQEVCPWNLRFSRAASEPAFQPRPGMTTPDLTQLLRLTEEEFADTFRESPVRRTRRRGLARNVAVALGNRRHPGDRAALAWAAREHDDPMVREHATWALAQVDAAEATPGPAP